jgi:predicted transcriptional regulator
VPDTNQVKDETRKLVEALPGDVTWDEYARRVWERRAIEQGRADIAAGRFVSTDELREKCGLKQ